MLDLKGGELVRRWSLLLVISLILISGCSKTEQPQPQQNSTKTNTQPQMSMKRPLTEEEKILVKMQGTLAGKNYDEAKLKAALDKLPSNLSGDQYMEQLLLLLAEDYRSTITTYANIDTKVNVDFQKPDGTITLPESKKLHISILLDASGSMKGQISGKSKMDSAKEAIQNFGSKLPSNAEVSLRVYGHKGTGSNKDKKLSCESSEEIYRGQGANSPRFQSVLSNVKPAGWTPIAKALESVKQDIQPETTESIVYVVSDGIETCGGNPAKVASELNQAKVKTIVNIIGFDVDNEGQKILKQVAESGGGTFTSVDNDQALKDYLNKEYTGLQEEWRKWKNTTGDEARKQKEKKKNIIKSAKEQMKTLVDNEKAHLKIANEYLKQTRGEKYPESDVFGQILDRHTMAFRYAVNTGDRLLRETIDSGNEIIGDAIDEGNKQINDIYEKKK